MDKELRTALYCRTACVCNVAIKIQEEMLRQYASDKNHGNITVYADNGYSGANLNRPALRRLHDDVDAGLVSLVLAKDIARISRNYLESTTFLDRVMSKGVQIRFVMDDIDYDELSVTV